MLFQRDFMKDVYYNDTPYRGETGQPLAADGFAGQTAGDNVGSPAERSGQGNPAVSALAGPQGSIPASAIDVGYVSYRLTRVTSDGGVYTITPRLIVPKNTVALPKGVARRFWLTVHIPAEAAPGVYTGQVTFTPRQGAAHSIPLRFTVRKGALDAVDIPVGPFGGRIGTPWFADDPATTRFRRGDDRKEPAACCARMDSPCSPAFPTSSTRDSRMASRCWISAPPTARWRTPGRYGFLAVNSYGAGVIGLDAYYQDSRR